MVWRAVAGIAGAVLYFAVLYRFQTYTQRNNLPPETFVMFAVAILVLGLVLTLASKKDWTDIATSLLVGVMAAHLVIIGVDTYEDKSNHNMLPFELVAFAALCAPAYLGAWVAKLAGKWLARS